MTNGYEKETENNRKKIEEIAKILEIIRPGLGGLILMIIQDNLTILPIEMFIRGLRLIKRESGYGEVSVRVRKGIVTSVETTDHSEINTDIIKTEINI